MNLNKKKLIPKVAWLLVFRPAEFWVYSYYILWARRGDAKVGDFGFPENVFVYGYSNYMVKFKFIFYPYRRPKWANSWHKERRVIKLSVKYKLLLGCVILWPKYTPQYFLSTFAYLPILGHPACLQHQKALIVLNGVFWWQRNRNFKYNFIRRGKDERKKCSDSRYELKLWVLT